MTEFISNDQLQLAFDFVQYTDKHIFLTGKAGTGKTTFLHRLKETSPKRMVVVAPTGVAAINAGGVTIHSFFQMPFGPFLPINLGEVTSTQSGTNNTSSRLQKFSKDKISIIKSLDLLVIDEISMVRADLLDGIDDVLRRYKDRNKPFGGVQLLMIGDLQQLAPVIKDEDWNLLRPYYDTVFFFSSNALRKTDYISIELTHIFRQKDEKFIKLLNRIRDNNADEQVLFELNKRFVPGFISNDNDGYITLTTHNYQSHNLNESKLEKLQGKIRRFTASVEGDFPDYSYPTDFELSLKKGAQVMFVKNDISRDKLFYNGKIGKIISIEEEVINVRCLGDQENISVGRVEWQNTKYTLDEESKEIRETVIGTFTQIPLKLAWSITIHKSQGLTFEKVIIDAKDAFAHGQVYVALSRCKTLDGLVLSTPISNQSIKSDAKVSVFNREIELHPPGKALLEESKLAFQQNLVLELFDFHPILRRLNYCVKLMVEHEQSIHSSLKELIELIDNDVKRELFEVSEKFKGQLHHLIAGNRNIEANIELQERIRKACHYFSEKLESIVIERLTKIDIEIDNKVVRKSVSDAVTRLTDDVNLKQACLINCRGGFEVKNYMTIRAKAAIEPSEKKLKNQTTNYSSESLVAHPLLYKNLKTWRNQKADELNVESFMILPQKVLMELMSQLPVSIQGLKKVKGLGPKKVSQFGKEILNIIIEYRIKMEMELPDLHEIKEPEAAIKIPKTDSKIVSLELFRSGKSIEEIAKIRGMASTTIEAHLVQFVETGEIGIERMVSAVKTAVITHWLLRNSTLGLAAAKAELGDDVSYSELRFVWKYLEFSKQIIP